MKAFSRTTAAAAVALASALVSTNASAVNVSADGVGQVAIAPLYTARNGWSTAINLTNTTNVPMLVKVRFHEAHNSRDVLDFNVAMSAFDVFTGIVRLNADGRPVFVNTDSPADGVGDNRDDYTCTIPNTRTAAGDAIEVPLNPLGFSGTSTSNFAAATTADNDDTGLGGNSPFTPNAQALERLKEGYVEFIVMGHADPLLTDATFPVNFAGTTIDGIFGTTNGNGSLTDAEAAAADTALNGSINIARAIEQHDCGSLQTALGLYNSTRALASSRQFGQPVNALKFTFAIINPTAGLAAGSPATTWANFYNPGNGSGGLTLNAPNGFVFPYDNFLCDIPRGAEHFSADAVTNWCPEGSSGNGCQVGTPVGDNAVPVVIESCRNLVTMQDFSEFLEPTLNDAYPHIASGWVEDTNVAVSATPQYSNARLRTGTDLAGVVTAANANAVENTRGVDALALTIQRQRIYNQFSNNPTLGARTESVVTSPVKAFYVDQGDGIQFQVPQEVNVGEVANAGQGVGTIAGGLPRNEAFVDEYAGVAFANAGDVPYLPFENAFAQETAGDRSTARACNQVAFALYDRAENPLGAAPAGDPPFSPAPPPESDPRDLCYEMTVINFGPNSLGGAPEAANRLDISDLVATLATQTGNNSGWFSLVMGPDSDGIGTHIPNEAYQGAYLLANVVANNQTGAPVGVPPIAASGLPVIGFTLATLNFPNRPDLSFGSVADHSYDRTWLTSANAVAAVAP